MRASWVFPIVLLANVAGCSVSSRDGGGQTIEQDFLFEVEYVNFAWGRVWKGFYVDRQGDVWTYDLAGAAWPHEGESSLTREQLLEKYESNAERVAQLDDSRLRRAFGQITEASQGTLTEPVQRCFDAGLVSFKAYMYDPSTERYAPVLLRQEGDWARENQSSAARALSHWLSELVPGFTIEGCGPE